MYGAYDVPRGKAPELDAAASEASVRRRPPKSSRRPRRRSPPSMYVAYDSPTTKAPKPLLKIDKKGPRTHTESSQRRPSVLSFLPVSRRPKTASGSAPIPPSAMNIPTTEPASHIPVSHSMHQTTESLPQSSKKAVFLLGETSSLSPEMQTLSGRHKGMEGEHVGASQHSSAKSKELSLAGEGFSRVEEEPFDSENSHVERDSEHLAPMEFASRPSSVAPTPPMESVKSQPLGSPKGFETPEATLLLDVSSTSLHRGEDPRLNCQTPRRPDSPFADTTCTTENAGHLIVRRSHGNTSEPFLKATEAKQSWMGEWNQDNIRDVIDKLRSLK
ncbi:hypothetical protein C8R43DRAFT_490301 [Mycena crocata]|nr:hypothetical protein C8R43DRAFT_490301 [Mycena crocata]